MIRSAIVAPLAAVAMLWCGACSGDDGSATITVATTTTTVPVTSTDAVVTEPPSTVPRPEFVLSDYLEFIEVSARLGVADDADLVALAVDAEVLETIEFDPGADLDDVDAVPAWCTGSDRDLAETDAPIPMYLVRIAPPGVGVTAGGAEWFELRAGAGVRGADPVSAEFELQVNGRIHVVPDAELDLGENANSGTFRGVSTDGLLIEGAFLCG